MRLSLKQIIDFLCYKDLKSNDTLGAYPERLHVDALPERRYLKTSRGLVVATLISLIFNFAMCFIFMYNATHVRTLVHNENSQDTFLYYLDTYDKELKTIEKPDRVVFLKDLLYQQLITDYIEQRYKLTRNREEMLQRWSEKSKIAAYAPRLYEDFLVEAEDALKEQVKGITKEPYVYIARSMGGTNLYEIIFDVFSLKEDKYSQQKCSCQDKTLQCLKCLRETAFSVKRYKAYARLFMNDVEISSEEIRKNINPFFFRVDSFLLYPHKIRKNNPWEDVDRLLNI